MPIVDAGRIPAPPDDENRTRAAAFDSVPVAQLVVDMRGVLSLANVQARALFGLTHKDIGRPLQDLELSYRPVELRSLIERARAERHQVTLRDVEWRSASGDGRFFDVQVAPLSGHDGSAVGTGVAFLDVTRYRRLQESLEESKSKLETAYEELQSTAEELETTNEELQSTNEELETTNEELQSTNEELETMNEELQSTNEELETMNDELRERTDEALGANAFLSSILGSIHQSVVVVDREFRVQAWSRAASDLWGLRADEVEESNFLNLDIGIPVGELRGPIRATLSGEVPEPVVLEGHNRKGQPVSCEVSFAPLRTHRDEIEGGILVMSAMRT
jgi:two-component system CheB/CheR fusion protein